MAHPGGVRSRVLFDYSKPEFDGYLYKQGGLHKAFKKRYFILYPGYLVYYSDESKYRVDVARKSLQNRLHAVRIKGGECHHTKESRDAPRGCKFGFAITAPDPINRRSHYLLNAASKEERRAWIIAVKKCCSTVSPAPSPQLPRANNGDRGVAGLTQSGTTDCVAIERKESPLLLVARSLPAQMLLSGSDSSEDSSSSPLMAKKSNYPNAIRRDTGMAALMTSSGCNSDDEDQVTTSFSTLNGPYADSEDDIGPEPEMLQIKAREVKENGTKDVTTSESHEDASVKESPPVVNGVANETATARSESPSSHHTASNTSSHVAVVAAAGGGKEEQYKNGHSPPTIPEEDESTALPDSIVAVKKEPQQPDSVAAAVNGDNSSSEDTEDNLPLPVDDDSTYSSTTSEDDDETPSQEKTGQLAINVINPSVKALIRKSQSSPALDPCDDGGVTVKVPRPAMGRRVSAPFMQKTGYLYKRGGRRPNWKQRFFVLTPGMFAYYKDEMQRTRPVGEVKLKNTSLHIPGPNDPKDQTYQFMVHTESQWNKRSNYILAAQSAYEMHQWVDAFNAAGQKVVMKQVEPVEPVEPVDPDTTR